MLKFEDKIVIAIVGSRTFNNFSKFCNIVDSFVDKYREQYTHIEIISGGARGTDKMASEYAGIRNIPFTEYKGDWVRDGGVAGFVRNSEIVSKCDKVIAFWNGRSSGTQDTIKKASNKNKLLHIELLESEK